MNRRGFIGSILAAAAAAVAAPLAGFAPAVAAPAIDLVPSPWTPISPPLKYIISGLDEAGDLVEEVMELKDGYLDGTPAYTKTKFRHIEGLRIESGDAVEILA